MKLSEHCPVTIVMTTYFPMQERLDVAYDTLKSWLEYLDYDGSVYLHVADDGSGLYHFHPEKYWKQTTISNSWQYRRGLGASLNAGFKKAFEISPVAAYFVDDWALTQELDITPWVEALMTNESIGCIRLGPPHPGLTGTIETISPNWQGWGLRLNKGGYAYGDRPALYHKRFFDAYSYFQEGVSALECVRLYDEKVARTEGPSIVLALEHKFIHLDSPSLSGIEPGV